MIFLTCLLYIVQFLIYKQFKQFYDINTMTGGAGDAITSYFSEIMHLIFRQGGIFVILLFLLPFILYLIFSSRLIPAIRGNIATRIVSVAASVISYVIALVLVFTSSIYAPVYRTQYNFQSAVSNFGLITGMRLDLQNNLFGGDLSFEEEDTTAFYTSGTDEAEEHPEKPPAEEPTASPIVYGYNTIDIDFDQLNENASDQIKALNEYVQSLAPSRQNEYTGLFKGKNLILITAEAFSAEVIDPELTPTLYRLATKGINFTDYYQPSSAGTTGGEYQIIFGMMPTDGGMSFIKHECIIDGANVDNGITFRDPKVFEVQDGVWGILIGGGQFRFYTSTDLTGWEFAGDQLKLTEIAADPDDPFPEA